MPRSMKHNKKEDVDMSADVDALTEVKIFQMSIKQSKTILKVALKLAEKL